MKPSSEIAAVLRGGRPYCLIEGDCTVDARAIPAGSIDLVCTDPPYGMKYQGKENRRKPILNDARPFVWFLPEAFRILRDGAALLCFCQWKGQEDFRRCIELAGFHIASHVIWNRQQMGMGHTGATFGPQHDVIWFATKGRYRFPGGRPPSVMSEANVPSRYRLHSTQKPTELMRRLIKFTAPPAGVVYDPCAGSGSTGEAAITAGFRFIGCELDPENAAIARRRLDALDHVSPRARDVWKGKGVPEIRGKLAPRLVA